MQHVTQVWRDVLQMAQVVLISRFHALTIKEHKLNVVLSKDLMELKYVVI